MNEQPAVNSRTEEIPAPGGDVLALDAREFEPPQPLLKTLEALTTLPPGATLRLHTRWKPAMLFPELEKRGFVSQSQEQLDGSCITHIRHR